MRTEETLPPRVLVGESSLGPVARWALDVKRRLARRNRHPRSLMNHAAAPCSKVNRAPEYLTPCCSDGSQLVGDTHAVVHVAASHSGHSGPLWVSSPHPNRMPCREESPCTMSFAIPCISCRAAFSVSGYFFFFFFPPPSMTANTSSSRMMRYSSPSSLTWA